MEIFKKSLCLAVVVLMVITMGACGSQATSEGINSSAVASTASDSTKQDEDVTLNVDFMFNMSSGTTDAKGIAVGKALERLKADHPNITVEMNTVSHDDYQTAMMTAAASNSLPDVFNIKGSWLKNFVTNKQVGSLDEYFKNNPDWKEQFIPDAFNDVTYEGSIYGAPFQMLTCGNIFYNKEIFAKAGYAEFPKTWDAYIDCLKKIKDLGYIPISMGNKGLWVANSCYFGTLADRAATDSWFKGIMANSGAKFTDPDILVAVEKFQELEKNGVFNTDMNSIDNSQQRTAYYNGKAASFFEGNWAISDMIVNCPKEVLDNTGIALLPTIPGSKGAADRVAGGSAWGNAYSASLEGAKKDAAILFLKYTTDNTYGKDLLDAGDFPGVKVPDYDLSKLNPFVKKYYDLRNTWTMAPQLDCQFDTSVIDAMNVGFQDLLTNHITPKQWGESVQAEYERSVN